MSSYRICTQGRSSARQSAFLTITFLFLSNLFQLDAADAAVFTVGDSSGWDFSVGNWTDGKHFKAGDVLVFNYDPSLHNVVAVDLNGYNRCSASAKSRTYTSGKDRIMLSKGNHYFICSYPGHCDGGMKIAISAS